LVLKGNRRFPPPWSVEDSGKLYKEAIT
jgi:hypothetical protein